MIISQLKQWFDLDQAVALLAATRLWQFLSAPVTLVLLSSFFSEERRGDYYTFIGLLAAQSLIDLGLSGIIVLLASHESAGPSACRTYVQGDERAKSRLNRLYRFSTNWYRSCAILYVLAIGSVGFVVLATDNTSHADFQVNTAIPWVFCIAINACSFLHLPMISLLEGCHELVAVNRMRLGQAISGTVVVWFSIAVGADLWTLVISNAVRLSWEVYLIRHAYSKFFKSLSGNIGQSELDWRSEIWPLQWRLAIQSVGGYLSSWFIVPAVRGLQGKVAAGQLGMTWQVLTNIQSVSFAWVHTKLPGFGKLAAAGSYAKIRAGMWKSGILSLAIVFAGVACLLLGLECADLAGLSLSSSFAPISAILFFAGSMIAVQIATIQHSYVRLFKRDPFLLQNIGGALLSAGVIWWFGGRYSLVGLSACYCLACWLYSVPLSTFIVIRHNSNLEATDMTPEPANGETK